MNFLNYLHFYLIMINNKKTYSNTTIFRSTVCDIHRMLPYYFRTEIILFLIYIKNLLLFQFFFFLKGHFSVKIIMDNFRTLNPL